MSRRIEVTAEMVASVVRPLVEAGTAVTAGDALVLVESMKMEIPIVAPESGTVASVHVTTGDVIEEGDLLAVVEPPAAGPPDPGGRVAGTSG